MLRQPDASNLIERLWGNLPLAAQIPDDEEDFFDAVGPLALQYDERRGNRRLHLRSRALMRHEEQLLGVFTCDLSSGGIGILSPVQLFPKDLKPLILKQEFGIRCRVVRCRRLQEHCYRIGAEVVETNSAETFKDLLSAALHGKANEVLAR